MRLKKLVSVGLSSALLIGSLFTNNLMLDSSVAMAADKPDGYTEVFEIASPLEDGVYKTQVNLIQYANPEQNSMGNAALRGSTNYTAKQSWDTKQATVIVKDGRATALLEYMPMGFLGTYGFMLYLDKVTPKYVNGSGYIGEESETTFEAASILTKHVTKDGLTVYDAFNNPSSSSVYNGNTTLPKGYGRDKETVLNISDVPYANLMSIDVTPVYKGESAADAPTEAADFTRENASYAHVFVPVMYSISPDSGDQYARLNVDWVNATKVENPEENVEYVLYSIMSEDTDNLDDESKKIRDDKISEIQDIMSRTWKSQEIEIEGTTVFDKIPKIETQRTEISDEEAANCIAELNLVSVSNLSVHTKLRAAINAAAAIDNSDGLYTEETFNNLQAVVENGRKYLDVLTTDPQVVSDAADAIYASIDALEYVRDAVFSALTSNVDKAKEISNDDNKYTAESFEALQNAIAEAEKVIQNPDATTEEIVNANYVLNNALSTLEEVVVNNNEDTEAVYYEVPIEAYNFYEEGRYSMMNNAIDHTAYVNVKDNKVTYTFYAHGLGKNNIVGHLLEFWVYNDLDEAKTNAEDATRLASTSNYYTESNLRYPGAFTFERNDIGEEVIYGRVHVDAMEGFNQNVKLVFDWAKAVKKGGIHEVSESKPETTTENTEKKEADKKSSVTENNVQKNETETADTSVENSDIDGLYYDIISADKKTARVIGVVNGIKKVTIPASVTIDGTKYKVTEVGKNAFKGMKTIKTVVIGNNVTKIGDGAFSNLKKLTKVTIGKNVKTIGKKAFYGDKKLKKIVVKSNKLKKVGKNALKGTSKKLVIKLQKKNYAKVSKLFKKSGAKKAKIKK